MLDGVEDGAASELSGTLRESVTSLRSAGRIDTDHRDAAGKIAEESVCHGQRMKPECASVVALPLRPIKLKERP
jgi:hypothetical protein